MLMRMPRALVHMRMPFPSLPTPPTPRAPRNGTERTSELLEGNVQYLGQNKKDFNAGEHNFHPGFALDENCAVADLKHVQEDAETGEQQH